MRVTRRGFLGTGSIIPAVAIFPGAVLTGCGGGGSVGSGSGSGSGSDEGAAETSGFAMVNGQKLYSVKLGRGPPVIFMHGGLGLDHQCFRPFVDPLADSAQVVYYDHLGHGKSDRPANFKDLTLARLSSDCDGLATALGFDKFVLVAHSYGGIIAIDFALRFPHRLKGLVLSCTPANTASLVMRNPLGGTASQQASLGRLFAGPSANSTDQALRTNWSGAVPLYYNNAAPPAGVLADVDQRTIYSATAFNRGNEILFSGYDFVPQLSGIQAPTAVHYGAGDLWRFGDNEKLATNVPQATLKYFQNSGHWPFQEEKAEFLDHMRSFLASLPR